jgi:hydrogenase maturation protease
MGCVYGMIKAIGIGNRIMMDDGIAIAVLENIKNNLESMGIEVIIGETDFQFYFHQLKGDDFVIILDAAHSGAVAGSIHLCKLEEAITTYGETNSQHDMSVFDLMRLYPKSLKGHIIGIEIAEAEFGCEISEVLKKKFNGICLEVEKIICDMVRSYPAFIDE